MPIDRFAAEQEGVGGLAPIHADVDRLVKITVCTRPFRAEGPRVEAERIGDKLVVHNYGHGGSGWSLSWGSGAIALELALAGRDASVTDIAVIGCGALGLTSAILAQRAGARSVTIYAKDLPSETRSFRATGSWTPDSRLALAAAAPPDFPALWQRMTRTSWDYFQNFVGIPGTPVEFSDRYWLSDLPPDEAERQRYGLNPLGFGRYLDGAPELAPKFTDFGPGAHPFPTKWARRRSEMMFNLTDYVKRLTDDFQRHGGRIVQREFHAPSEFAGLAEPVIIHATGYAARELFGDTSLTPVRGQIGWLPAQPEVNYGIYVGNLTILGRPDGIVVQLNEKGDVSGWGETSEEPDRREAEEAVRQLRDLQERMRPGGVR